MATRPTAAQIRTEFRKLGNPDIAAHSGRFFKSDTGEYGEGDRFLGIRVPETRKQVRLFQGIYNFRDFADDPTLRIRAGLLLDLYWATWGQEQINGVRGGGKTRVGAAPADR